MSPLDRPIDRILVVAATARELAPPAGWRTLCCGVGPVEAAAATAAAIAAAPPAAVLHVGVAGVRRRAALAPGTLVVGAEARYDDLMAGLPAAWAARRVAAAPALLGAARRALPGAPVLPIGTSARVGGTAADGTPGGADACPVEAMEGFGVLRAAERAGVPAVEVRAIANEVEEPDRGRWHLDAAFAAITAATPALVAAVAAALAEFLVDAPDA